MEKKKLINLTKKLSKFGRGKNPSDIYSKLTKDNTYQDFYKILSAEDLILLCFMIPKYETDLDSLYDEIKTNLFAFNTVTVDNMEPMETCTSCAGDGEVICGNCDGVDEIECDKCNGEGQIEIGDDEYRDCSSCGGFGYIDCQECSKGYVECDDCYGHGEVEIDDSVEATLDVIISYDKSVREKVELLNEFDKIELSELIQNSHKIILLHSDTDVTSILPDPESGGEYMYEFSDYYHLTLRKANTYIAVDSLNGIF